ncbi:MAG: GtrA family protein [Hydrogenophaga sp.]
MLASTPLAISYAIFALIATAANIVAQDVTTRLYSGSGYIVSSMIVGTGVGLLVKYWLDKRYIFRFRASNVAHDTRTFALYSFMGLFTTVVFWGFEWGFHWAFETKEMRYLGGVIGLTIGYLTKYHLDKRFVFKSKPV